MSKIIETGSDSRTKLLKGVNKLEVGVTVMVPKFGAQVVVVENETYIVAGERDVLGIIKQKEDNE